MGVAKMTQRKALTVVQRKTTLSSMEAEKKSSDKEGVLRGHESRHPMSVQFVRMPDAMRAAIKVRAEAEGRTVSGWIRYAVTLALRRRAS
jgi:predicted HicB family RNase H-like nuclease